MSIENKLKLLFDFQHFQGNKKLARVIESVNVSTAVELDDESLSLVNAAGDPFAAQKPQKDEMSKRS